MTAHTDAEVFARRESVTTGVDEAIAATVRWFADRQRPDGHWVGELEGDTILESEYVLLMAFLGREGEPVCVKACKYLRDLQLPDGGWAIYPGGPPEVSASVKAYFALKLVGVPDDRARHGPRSRSSAETRRRAGVQQFHTFLFRLARPDSVCGLPLCPARTGARAVVVEFQSRRDVVVDAHDHRAAHDHVGVQAGAEICLPNAASANSFATTCRAIRADGPRIPLPGATSSTASTT